MKNTYPFIFFLFFCFNPFARSADLTDQFLDYYSSEVQLSKKEIHKLNDLNFVLVPGILSESFVAQDTRSYLNFSLLTKDYFGAQKKLLTDFGFSAQLLSTSSFSVSETRENIRSVLNQSILNDRKILFLTHSLGGIALLEELISNPSMQKAVGGIIFLQSPFSGSPMADVFLDNPYYIETLIKPFLPFVNTSEETITYLSMKIRAKFIHTHFFQIRQLLKNVPLVTVGTIANGVRTIFRPSVDILSYGCIRTGLKKCVTGILFEGPYDLSDGMVPFKSSLLMGADFIRLQSIDHGEMVLNLPFEDYNKDQTTISLLKLMITKLE